MSISSIRQIIVFAWQSFWRNFWLSIVTITIIVLAFISVNFLLILNILSDNAIKVVQNKVDVSLYFNHDASESQVLETQIYLSAVPQIDDITYISQAQALEQFKQKHQGDADIIQSLNELQENPLGATLIIKAKDIGDYPDIIDVVNNSKYNNLIQDKSFDDNEVFIDRIKEVSDNVNRVGLIASGIFILISLLIVFNTIRVAIYTHREEISIMKLVGATNWYIRSPFLLESIIYGLLGVAIAMAVTYPILGLIQPYVNSFFLDSTFNLAQYFSQNIIKILGVEFLITVLLNVLSSIFAMRKYLKV
ncbi:MAG: ABC transporter permease [Candidatus Buchananbacteria bacterium]|nr:ABC transporter permease [Candidatus Buchananbacteria bacterium]